MLSDVLGERPVRISAGPHGWGPQAEMELVRDRLAHLTPDDHAELFLFPATRTAAFSRRDTLLAGYEQAHRAMVDSGFTPVIRPVGGHLAVYDEGTLVLHLCAPHAQPREHIQKRFLIFGDTIASALQGLGVDARLGPVPGEYCDGKYSVNDSGRSKLAGTGQRIVAGGYLFSAVVMVRSSPEITRALTRAYDLLGLEFAPETVGAVADTVPDVSLDLVRDRLLAAFAELLPLEPVTWPTGKGAEAVGLPTR